MNRAILLVLLAELERRFPWLKLDNGEPETSAEVVVALSHWHQELSQWHQELTARTEAVGPEPDLLTFVEKRLLSNMATTPYSPFSASRLRAKHLAERLTAVDVVGWVGRHEKDHHLRGARWRRRITTRLLEQINL
jgi:hypothetical protein